MKNFTLAGVLAFLCLYAQGQEKNIKPLTIGDPVPNIKFSHIINMPSGKANLFDYKKKCIIIDLWSRHCLACITAFPKVEQYQKKFADRLQFILANPHDVGYEKEVVALLNGVKKRTGFYPSLPLALNDTLLNAYFPHAGVPHYIWINDKRQVAVITGVEDVTERNIVKFISGQPLHLAVKDAPEYAKDLLSLIRSGEIKDTDLISYSFFTGYQPHTNLRTKYVLNPDNSISSYHIINQPLSYIIGIAYRDQINDLPANRVFNYPANKDSVYCYQLKPGKAVINSSGLAKYIRADLQRAFHFTGASGKREMECLVLKDIRNLSALKSKFLKPDINFSTDGNDAIYIHGLSLEDALRYIDKLPLPLVNETGCAKSQLFDLEFPKGFAPQNEQQVIKWFQNNGFLVQRERRLLDVFEFSSTL